VTFGPTTSVLVAQPQGSSALALAALIAVTIAAIASAVMQGGDRACGSSGHRRDRVDFAGSYRWGLRRFGRGLLVALIEVVIVAIGFTLLVIPGITPLVLLAVASPRSSSRRRAASRRFDAHGTSPRITSDMYSRLASSKC
jgi:hypothetical protein